MAAETEAIEALTALGLTTYEARCFVALTRLSQGTAKEISRVGDLPQSRVYDVTDQLHHRGLIEIEESDPRRYCALPAQRAIERLDREYSERLETANDALQSLDSRRRDEDGAWTIETRESVITRIRMNVDDATEEVYLHVAHEDLFEPELLEALVDAHGRGATVYVGVPSEVLRAKIHDRLPASNVAVSDTPLEAFTTDDSGPDRLLMVDRRTILLSARKEGLVPGRPGETGLWSDSVGHGLVWLRPLLTAQIDQWEFTTAE